MIDINDQKKFYINYRLSELGEYVICDENIEEIAKCSDFHYAVIIEKLLNDHFNKEDI